MDQPTVASTAQINPNISSRKSSDVGGVVRLRDLKNASKEEKLAAKPVDEKFSQGNTQLSEQPLEESWNEIIQFLRNEKREQSLASLLEQIRPEINQGNIRLEFATHAQKALFQEHYVDVRSRLVKKFGNRHKMELEVNTVKEIKAQIPITPEDQFNEMASKNPNLVELKKRLGLEFE